MENKHTKGPWKMAEINDEGNNLTHCIVAEYDDNLLITYALPPTDCSDEFYKNARLIAAAPELLEALTHLCKTVRPYMLKLKVKKGFSELVALVEAEKAIAKATE